MKSAKIFCAVSLLVSVMPVYSYFYCVTSQLVIAYKKGVIFVFRINLKVAREKAGISQKQLADKIGVAQGTVGNWEAGIREPSLEVINKLATILNVHAAELISDDLTPPKAKSSPAEAEDDDITFDNFTYAFLDESKELTEAQKEMLLTMARMLKEEGKKRDRDGQGSD